MNEDTGLVTDIEELAKIGAETANDAYQLLFGFPGGDDPDWELLSPEARAGWRIVASAFVRAICPSTHAVVPLVALTAHLAASDDVIAHNDWAGRSGDALDEAVGRLVRTAGALRAELGKGEG